MKLASGALAAGFSAGAVHGDEAATEEGLIVKDLGETGPGPTFGVGQMTSRTHKESPPFAEYLTDIFIYIRIYLLVKCFFECEFAQGSSWGLKLWNPLAGCKEKNRLTEFLLTLESVWKA